MALSEAAVRAAKPKDKPYKLADSAGLYLYVPTTGARLWRLDYRFSGKRRTLAIGGYPLIGLADARKKRDEARRLLVDGIDPSLLKRKPVDTVTPTFGEIADEYLDRLRHDECAPATIDKNTWLLKNLARSLDRRPIVSVTPADVLEVLRAVEASGRLESANRLRSAMSAVFRLAVVTLRAETDPTAPLRGAIKAPKVRNQSAITDEKTFGALASAIENYDGWPTLTGLLRFTMLTVCRPGEARLATWSEFDIDKTKWMIPAARTKMRRDHDVPLSRQAIEVLRAMRSISGRTELVFPSIRSYERPLSENAMNAALRRMGYAQDEHTAHGFRSSFSTIMNSRGYDPDVIERALAHKDGSVRGIYNRSRYWTERVELLQAWADLIDKLKNPGT